MMGYSVALVGCGRIAQRHAGILSELDCLSAVCDIDTEKCVALAEKYHVGWYSNMETMMERVQPDIVTICTPSGMHADHVVTLAPYGADIIVEKPLALTLEDVDRAVEACAAAGVRLCTVKQNRYNVAVVKTKEALDTRKLGGLNFCSVRIWWRRDHDYYRDWHGTWKQAGGVLANQAIHHIDLMQWFIGPVKRVYAEAIYSISPEVETGLVATVRFERGTIGTVECTTLTQPVNLTGSISILGGKGTIVLGGFAVNQIDTWAFGDGVTEMSEYAENPPDVYGYGHRKFYEDIFNRGDGDWPVSWFEGRKSLEIVTAMYESIETGKPVELREKYRHSRLGK